MPLDGETFRLLEMMRKRGAAPLHTMPVADSRAALRALMEKVDVAPEPLESVRDVTIRGPAGQTLPIRIYAAAPGSGARPAVLFIHGGGFALGDLDTHDRTCRYIAARADALVVAVDYRRAPEQPFPAAVEDCGAALRWLAARATTLGAHPGRIVVSGDSAGGNLAIVTVIEAIRAGGPAIAGLVPIYPVVDLRPDVALYPSRREFGDGSYFLSGQDLQWFADLYAPQAGTRVDPRCSPLFAPIPAGLPPTLIIAAGCDVLADEGRLFAERLRQAGVPVTYRLFPGTVHGFVSFSGLLESGRTALDTVCTWIRAVAAGGSFAVRRTQE